MKKLAFIASLILLAGHIHAQIKIPAFDVAVKGGLAGNIGDISTSGLIQTSYWYNMPLYSAEMNFHVGQRIALGAFISRSFGGKVSSEINNPHIDFGDTDAAFQLYGVQLRFSAGRKPGFRPYAMLSFYKSEMYFDYNTYRLGNSTTGLGLSIGSMIRLNDKFYLNIPEISIRTFNDPFFFSDEQSALAGGMIEFRAGVTYNFTKRK
jgi:hypothetical protein